MHIKRALGSLWLVVLCFCVFSGSASAQSVQDMYMARSGGGDYADYVQKHTGYALQADQVMELCQVDDGAMGEGDSVTLHVNVANDVFGYLVIDYAMTGNNILDNIYTLMVDGAYPYIECEALMLDSLWTMASENALDRYGNEVVTMPEKSYERLSGRLKDKASLYNKGMGLYLTSGDHEITITCKDGPFTVYGLRLESEIIPQQQAQGQPIGNALISLEAEQVPMRNNPNIRPAADYDMSLSPYSSDKKVINYIQDTSGVNVSYGRAGDILTYTFTVEQEGYYALALRMRQTELANFPVYRTFYIDGVIPSEAFDTAEFDYALNYVNQSVKDGNGGQASVYLTQGEHTLSIQTTVDPVRPSVQMLTLVCNEMAQLALDITKITGGNADFFRDFNLEDFGFHVADDMDKWISELIVIRKELHALTESNGKVGALSNLDVALEQLQLLAKEPNDLPKKLKQFSQGTSSVRSMLVTLTTNISKSPVALDSIFLYQDSAKLRTNPGIITQGVEAVRRFIASFTDQGYVAGLEEDNSRLQIWVNRPRQYLEIMQRMADTSFTPETGIAVDFSIMPDESKLILANASGSAPDVALGVSSGRVYDLAVRGALMNLRAYDDFKTVGSWFPTGLLIPGVCDEGLYALPETFNFYVLFYRKDILSSIGLEIPDSYQDVLAMLPTLQRYGLNYNNFIANSIGFKSLAITTPFIFQNGGKLYEDNNIKVLLDDPQTIEGLKLLTDSFIVYDMDYEINSFYQSFRDGTLPIGTANYAMYNLLMNAAPELTDRWGIALYPGIKDEDGNVSRWTSGAEQSNFIFSSTEMADESWQFLTWWMSEETQTEFAFTLQSTLGNEYLWNSANTAAFSNSPWPTEHKKVIAEQMTWIYEAPRLPGNYMVERELSNAVNGVVLEGTHLRTALDEAMKRIDREMERKLEEFGRLENGELTVPFVAPSVEVVEGWLE